MCFMKTVPQDLIFLCWNLFFVWLQKWLWVWKQRRRLVHKPTYIFLKFVWKKVVSVLFPWKREIRDTIESDCLPLFDLWTMQNRLEASRAHLQLWILMRLQPSGQDRLGVEWKTATQLISSNISVDPAFYTWVPFLVVTGTFRYRNRTK